MAQVSSFLLSADAVGRYRMRPTQILCQLPNIASQTLYYRGLQGLWWCRERGAYPAISGFLPIRKSQKAGYRQASPWPSIKHNLVLTLAFGSVHRSIGSRIQGVQADILGAQAGQALAQGHRKIRPLMSEA